MENAPLTPLLIEGAEIAQVRLAPPDRFPTERERRLANLGLGVVQLPSVLEGFRPQRPMPPQERFLLIVRAFCEAMHDGKRSQLDEGELVRQYMQVHGMRSFLHHQVRRASGDVLCDTCQSPYRKHKFERGLLDHEDQPFIHRLCNGDLVKL
jgi:hypothetical protein